MTTRRTVIPAAQQATYDRFHFAPAVRVGTTVYASGVIGLDAEGHLPDTVAAEFANVFATLAHTLEEAGASLADVVDMTSFHVDMPGTLRGFMEARDAAMSDPYPAWTAIGCTGLAIPGAHAEVKVIAVVGEDA